MNIKFDVILVVAGVADPACVLEQIELEIGKVKEEAFSRKELLEKVEKWMAACEEESWLEEYNRVECLTQSSFYVQYLHHNQILPRFSLLNYHFWGDPG